VILDLTMVLIMTMNIALSTILSTQDPRITAQLRYKLAPMIVGPNRIPIMNTKTMANMIVLAGIITARSTMDLLDLLDTLRMDMNMVDRHLIRGLDMGLTRTGRCSMDMMGLLDALKTNNMDLLGLLEMDINIADQRLIKDMDMGLTRTGRCSMDIMDLLDALKMGMNMVDQHLTMGMDTGL
jgi:hypothetical protein